MSIENRNLSDGMKLVAKYKGAVWTAGVATTEDGLQIKLEDGRLFKSLSSAGSAVMGGTACNGWRFWSIAQPEGATKKAQPKATPKRAVTPPKTKAASFEALPPADGQPEDVTRFYCEACADAFTAPSEDGAPRKCPQGHKPAEASV
jgi:hypothetical protein